MKRTGLVLLGIAAALTILIASTGIASAKGPETPAQNLAAIDDKAFYKSSVTDPYDNLLLRISRRCEGASKTNVADWVAFTWDALAKENEGRPVASCLELLGGLNNSLSGTVPAKECMERMSALLIILKP